MQEGGPLTGSETELLSSTRKCIARGDICADKARDFIGKGTWVESNRVREPRRTALSGSVGWLSVSGFMVMGLVSGWSLANHSNSESFLAAHPSLSQDGC